jgi:LysM repeat protein
MTTPAGAPLAAEPGMEPASSIPSAPDHPMAHRDAPDVAADTCPYLESAGGPWRMAMPSREHRCAALEPPAPQTTEKQRRHCLAAEHVDCPIYRAARSARATTLAAGADPGLVDLADRRRRPIARTAPILLESPRLMDHAMRLQFERGPGQLALIALMIVAFVIVALARLSSGATPSPSTGPTASPSTPAQSPLSSQAAEATPSVDPSVDPSVVPIVDPSIEPAASYRTSYTVRKGDTLAAIAGRFGTTVEKISRLNALTSTNLRIGQVLKIP